MSGSEAERTEKLGHIGHRPEAALARNLANESRLGTVEGERCVRSRSYGVLLGRDGTAEAGNAAIGPWAGGLGAPLQPAN